MIAPLDVLARIIAHVESNNNPYAMRFEPNVEAHEKHRRLCGSSKDIEVLQLIERENVCTFETAEVIYSTSWGLYQIMGYNLYNQGYDKSIGSYLCNHDAQDRAFVRFLQHVQLPYTWDDLKGNNSALEHFAVEYNGPQDPDTYMRRMVEAASLLNV